MGEGRNLLNEIFRGTRERGEKFERAAYVERSASN